MNLGIFGDLGIFCPGVEEVDKASITDPDGDDTTVHFYDPDRGEDPEGDVSVPLKPGFNSEGAYCIGGASGAYSEGTQADVWGVWIHDYLWDNLEGPLEYALDHANLLLQQDKDPQDPSNRVRVDLKTAGFARMTVEYELSVAVKEDAGTSSVCVSTDEDGDGVPDPVVDEDPSGHAVCVQDGVGTHSVVRSINNFGFCGQGTIDADSGMVEPFEVMAAPDAPGDPENRTNKTATKEVFVDGLLFYQTDCPLVDQQETFNEVAGIINDGFGPLPGMCDGEFPDVICVDPVPTQEGCYLQKQDDNVKHQNIGVVGLVGTVGWSHDATQAAGKCREVPFHGVWLPTEPGPTVTIKNG